MIRKASIKDVEQLVDIRMEFVSILKKINNIKEFKDNTKEYFLRNLSNENCICYIKEQEEGIVAVAMLCIYETLPTPNNHLGKQGVLLDVYTKKDYRRKGYAQSIISHIIMDAKRLHIGRINLDYIEESRELFEKLGFKKLKNEMRLVI